MADNASEKDRTGLMKNVFTKEKPERFWWLTIIILIAVTVTLVIVFSPVDDICKLVCVELALGVAALVVGGLLGFLFGIPKTTPLGTVPKSDLTGAEASRGTVSGGASKRSVNYEPSANLEQVADWLTKILLGAGLVQLKEIRQSLIEVGTNMQDAFGGELPGIAILTQAILVAFVVIGFLASYLWTRIHYGGIQARADNDLLASLAIKAAEAEKERDESHAALKKISEKGLVTQTTATAAPADAAAVEQPWPEQISEKIRKLEETPVNWDEDTIVEIFGHLPAVANGRRLEAKKLTDLRDELVILLRVSRLPDGQPLEGDVAFLLHSTYDERVVRVKAENGQAELTIAAAGSFTVGAITDGQTVLTYDLGALPGAPKWFIEA